MTLSRSFAAGAVGIAFALMLPFAASASVWDYNGPSIFDGVYCVNYGYPNSGGCSSSGSGYYYPPYIQQQPYYSSQSYYKPQPVYYYQPAPQYYYPQQYAYYQPVTVTSTVVPTVMIDSGYYGYDDGYGYYGDPFWY